MHILINIIGDAFADIYCYLEGDMPQHGGDARLLQPMHTLAGGSGVNTATHLSALLRDFFINDSGDSPRTFDVNLQTAINENDEYGRAIISHCDTPAHKVSLINRRVSNHPSCHLGTNEAALRSHAGDKSTGHCAVIVSKGERSFMTHLGCIEDFRASHILTNLGRNHGNGVPTPTHQYVHIAGYYNIPGFWEGELASKLAEMKEIQSKTNQRITISLVPQHDATEEWDGGLLDILQHIDFLILNELEAKSISGYAPGDNDDNGDMNLFQHIGVFFYDANPETYIIMTRGSKGAIAFYEGEIVHRQKTMPEILNPTDPTGAGDAFAAGFIHGYLSYQSKCKDKVGRLEMISGVRAGMQMACAVGTCCVMVQGASIPSKRKSIEQIFNGISEHDPMEQGGSQ